MHGIIDLGSNTARISIYQIKNNRLSLYDTKKENLGLASYLNKSNTISKEGISAAISSILRFKRMADNYRVEKLYLVATAAVRNSRNAKSVIKEIEKKTGLKVDLLSGKNEGIYDFYGVMQNNKAEEGLIVDIGGGSCEIVTFKDRKVDVAEEIKVGSLTAFIKQVKGLIPSNKEVDAIEKIVKNELKKFKFDDKIKFNKIIGVGGTIRNAVKVNNEINLLPNSNLTISYKEIKELIRKLVKQDKTTIFSILKNTPDRIHTLVPGLIILKVVTKKFNSSVVVSEGFGLREGYVYKKSVLDANRKAVSKNGKKGK